MGMQPLRVPLQGINLVEASAGTGKTHTLTTLYLRLVLEQGIEPDRLLVMTYTKAATAELKQRIRERLTLLRRGVGGEPLKDETLAELAAAQADPERAGRLLDLALSGFDQAAVFTIHCFCQRVLTEHAFETGQAFRTELVPDPSARLQEIVDDFWRRETDRLPPLFLRAMRERAKLMTPDDLLSRLRFALGKPYLQVRFAAWPERLPALEEQALALREETRRVWRESRDDVLALLTDNKVINGRSYRPDLVGKWYAELGEWLTASPYDKVFDKADRFTPQRLRDAVKTGRQAPAHPFFDLMASYLEKAASCGEALRQGKAALLGQCYGYLAEELPKRQAEAGEWSYDDLLLELHRALSGPGGGRLASLLRQRYPAALVDEFQDTDPVQYEILRAVYGGHPLPLFLVGDPKQAIYSFRGADVFAYLRARGELVTATHTLDTNWRSGSELIRGVNALFERAARPFWHTAIGFRPVRPATQTMPELSVRHDRQPPLRLWRLPYDRSTPVDEVREAVAEATANEIARLLARSRAGEATLDGRPLRGSDFAVLVRTHQQAERIALALRALGVNSVRNSRQSVFETREAEALERLMLALLEPQRGGRVRAALATPLLGWDAARLDALNRDDRQLEAVVGRFYDYHRRWREQGFIVMFRRLLAKEGIENRLLDYRDGARRLTNLNHLAELLYQQESEAGPGQEALTKWLAHQRQTDDAGDENRLLRLESDSHLVRIDTLHGSKGLQYPLVFCPYLWDEGGGRENDNPYLFHDPEADYAAVLELGSERFDRDRRHLREEALAENLRLLYVALTRARHRCYLPWGGVKNSERSALAWLLHGGALAGEEREALAAWDAFAAQLDEAAIDADLEALVAQAPDSVAVTPMPTEQSLPQAELDMPPRLEPARRFEGRIPPLRRVASFSSLVAGHSEDLPDYDAERTAETLRQPAPEGFDIHGFPRGSGPGRCLHAILEQVDFGDLERTGLETFAPAQLRLHGIEERWAPVVEGMLRHLVVTPLNEAGLTLSLIRRDRRVDEMEFHFPVHGLDPRHLKSLGEAHGFSPDPVMTEGLGSVAGGRLEGFVKGFIDLIFEWEGRYYLADYKSNWLGHTLDDYRLPALQSAMLEHGYPLQYALYTLALHRHLGRRLRDYDYERHFGGVFYLFLRGVTPSTGRDRGVVAERPSREFVEALDRLMEGARGTV